MFINLIKEKLNQYLAAKTDRLTFPFQRVCANMCIQMLFVVITRDELK